MKNLAWLWILVVAACAPKEQKTVSTDVEILDAEAEQFFDQETTVETLCSGFEWSEGPLYIEDGDFLLFSDVPANKIYKYDGDTATYLTPSGFTGEVYHGRERGSNGLLLNHEQKLVLLQHGDRRVAQMLAPINQPKPLFLTLVDSYEGLKFNSPNDGAYAANGDLYFTDPPYGLDGLLEDSTKELSFQGIYVLRVDGTLSLIDSTVTYPNGIALASDQTYLIVSSSDLLNKTWYKYTLNQDGTVASKTTFHEAKEDNGIENGSPDGLKINKAGYVFASGPEGLWVFNPAGKVIAKVKMHSLTSNVAFGPNEQEIYLTCDDTVKRIKLKSPL